MTPALRQAQDDRSFDKVHDDIPFRTLRVERLSRPVLALLTLAMLFAEASATDAGDYRVAFQLRAFHDCNDAAGYVAAHAVVAHMVYQVRLFSSPPKISRLGSRRYRADIVLHSAIDPRAAVLTMPQWSWPAMNASEKVELRSYMDALQQHEVGHLLIAQRYLAGGATTLHIFGPDPAKLGKRLQPSTRRYSQDLNTQLQSREQLYDRVTEHGAAQREASAYGFPTGPDVKFRCP
ncbi:MAG: DUF922 domain-containing Zn-dependent protease [Candidatus Eremiobacteraeota bacterium]|nr:DUF922 domain-containing Zn-dependent protease [Candidatus Eremiobacteraeota bacterium]